MTTSTAPQRSKTDGQGGFVLFLAIVAGSALAFAIPPLRDVVVNIVTLPALLFSWIAPGETPYADAQIVGRLLGWAGWALTPLLLTPLLALTLFAARLTAPAALVANIVRWCADIADKVCDAIGGAAYWLSAALVAVVGVVVVQRYVFGISFTKLQELVIYLHAGLFLLAAAATLRADGHVRVDVLYSKLTARGRAIVNLLGGYALLGVTALVILRASRGYVDAAWRVGESSAQADGLALVYLLKTLIPVFAVMMIAQGASLAGRAALTLMGQGDEADAAPSGEMAHSL